MSERHPLRYKKNIRILCDRLCIDADKAYAMMLMTAALMDLQPEDTQVVGMILEDCGVEV